MTLKWNGDEVMAALHDGVARGLVRAVESVREEAVSLIENSPRGGRVYRHGGVTHKASAPGEPPAPDTGDLARRIATDVDPEKLEGRVTFSSAHAAALEFGTVKIAPRPFLRPAVANKREEIERDLGAEIRTSIERVSR